MFFQQRKEIAFWILIVYNGSELGKGLFFCPFRILLVYKCNKAVIYLDRQDISSFQKGDWLAMQALWERYKPLSLSLLKRYGGAEREDLLSEIKLIFIQLLLEYDLSSSVPPPGYLKNKLTQRVHNYIRKKRQAEWKEILLPQISYRLPVGRQGNNSFSKSKDAPLSLANWSGLGEQQKKILELIFYHSYSEREVAVSLAISPSRVNKVKKIALEKLKRGEQS